LHQLKTGQVFHNYLFCGGRGTWKTSTARLLAQAVNCTMMDANGFPDLLHDPLATQIREGKTLDVIEIDAASHTGVDNIREEIIEKSSYPPAQLKKKVYIIDEVHMLSKGAFNALLKIMEEPPSYVMFILATTELHKVPETIVSRCQVFNFKQLTVDQTVGQLQMIADVEKIPTTVEWLNMIAKLAGGAMRDAIKYLEQVSMLGSISPENVSQFLGIASDDMIGRIIQAILDQDTAWLIGLLESLSQWGTDMVQLIKDCMNYCNDNFDKNPGGYAMIARQLKELFQSVKWYPNALLAWKVTFSGDKIQEIWEQKQGTRDQKKATGAVYSVATEEDPSLSIGWQRNTVAQQVTSSQEPIANSQEPTANSGSVNLLITTDQLLEALINACEKMMIKSALRNSTMIDRVHDGVLEAVVIQEQNYHIMNKPEIIAYLESLVEKCGYGKLQIKLIYMTKEDYMMKSMIA
jgi:DNA polymerase III subunit gamma/tau